MADSQQQEIQGTSSPEDLLDKLIRMAQEEVPSNQTATPPSTPTANDTPTNTPVSGGLLGGLLSNPAMLSALPQLMSNLGPLLSGSGQKTPALPTAQESKPSSTSPAHKASIPVDRHTALLCAIKPYLGRERQQAAEQMINLCRVWSTLQGMGISLPMLLSAFGGGQGDTQHKEV